MSTNSTDEARLAAAEDARARIEQVVDAVDRGELPALGGISRIVGILQQWPAAAGVGEDRG